MKIFWLTGKLSAAPVRARKTKFYLPICFFRRDMSRTLHLPRVGGGANKQYKVSGESNSAHSQNELRSSVQAQSTPMHIHNNS